MTSPSALLDPPTAHGARVLVVDDSPMVCAYVKEKLSSSFLEADVTTVTNGADALKQALDDTFDCVICDLRMPGLDGFAVLRQLRQRFNLNELPILILTVAERTQDKVAGFHAGASDFLVKPVAEEELLARVQTHVLLTRMHRKLQVLVDTDPLTGCGNRRLFMRTLQQETGRAFRHDRDFGLLLLDVDHFKKVNDTLGHQAGDAALRDMGNLLMKSARKYDTVARLGGEEFAILLPETSTKDIVAIAERYRMLVEKGVPGRDAGVTSLTVSIGAASGPLEGDLSGERLYGLADRALYASKHKGRNCVSHLGADDERLDANA